MLAMKILAPFLCWQITLQMDCNPFFQRGNIIIGEGPLEVQDHCITSNSDGLCPQSTQPLLKGPVLPMVNQADIVLGAGGGQLSIWASVSRWRDALWGFGHWQKTLLS